MILNIFYFFNTSKEKKQKVLNNFKKNKWFHTESN